MNFSEAIELLKQGKKVKGNIYGKDGNHYLYLKKGIIHCNECGSYDFGLPDFEATDWEEYKEEDKWNWLVSSSSGEFVDSFNPVRSRQQKLQEKILEDIDKTFLGIDVPIEMKKIIKKRFGW